MEQLYLCSVRFECQAFSFQEVLDWRFLIRGTFLLVSFVNCT
uniref:Uncharacterized protein n=2 Tax=Nicotiana TaxID=4085 RepID=A0A1S4CRG4_TOBAC|nr:PREDICTED: uncharacterized protein LOC104241281 [Nicotiana sylvestris]XP_016503609.1 PREDICTED: uncharacterized protein LOC107821685 [Nicotiana tabacum]